MVPNNWEDQRGRYKGFLAPRPWYTQEPTLNLPTMEARMNSADEFGALPMVSAGKYGKSPSADRLGPIRFAADRACLVTKAQVQQEVLGRVAPLVGCVQKSALWSSTEHCLFLWAVWIFRIRGLRLLLRNDGWELTIKDHFHRSLWRLWSRQNLLAVLHGANQHAYFRNSAVVKQMTWSFNYSDRGHIIGLCSLPRLLTRDWINRLRNIKTKEASAFATAHIRTQTQQFYVPAQVHAIHLLNRFCLFRKKKKVCIPKLRSLLTLCCFSSFMLSCTGVPSAFICLATAYFWVQLMRFLLYIIYACFMPPHILYVIVCIPPHWAKSL